MNLLGKAFLLTATETAEPILEKNPTSAFWDKVKELAATFPDLSDHLLDMIVTVYRGSSHARVRIADEHTNIVRIERDGRILQENASDTEQETEDRPDYDLLTVEKIWDFACTCDTADVKDILDRQMESYDYSI